MALPARSYRSATASRIPWSNRSRSGPLLISNMLPARIGPDDYAGSQHVDQRLIRKHLADDGEPIAAVGRLLDHLAERACSPHTLCAYGYDLQQLFTFLAGEQLVWQAFGPADALRFLAFLRRRPSQRPAQRLG